MRLTIVNFIKRKTPHGYAYRGKYRLVKKVEIEALQARFTDLERQERNMLFLRHPYLTVEQSQGYMKDLRTRDSQELHHAKHNNAKFNKKFTWAEQLSHLRVKDAWD